MRDIKRNLLHVDESVLREIRYASNPRIWLMHYLYDIYDLRYIQHLIRNDYNEDDEKFLDDVLASFGLEPIVFNNKE